MSFQKEKEMKIFIKDIQESMSELDTKIFSDDEIDEIFFSRLIESMRENKRFSHNEIINGFLYFFKPLFCEGSPLVKVLQPIVTQIVSSSKGHKETGYNKRYKGIKNVADINLIKIAVLLHNLEPNEEFEKTVISLFKDFFFVLYLENLFYKTGFTLYNFCKSKDEPEQFLTLCPASISVTEDIYRDFIKLGRISVKSNLHKKITEAIKMEESDYLSMANVLVRLQQEENFDLFFDEVEHLDKFFEKNKVTIKFLPNDWQDIYSSQIMEFSLILKMANSLNIGDLENIKSGNLENINALEETLRNLKYRFKSPIREKILIFKEKMRLRSLSFTLVSESSMIEEETSPRNVNNMSVDDLI